MTYFLIQIILLKYGARRPEARALIEIMLGQKIAYNGIGLRRWAEPNRGEAQCG